MYSAMLYCLWTDLLWRSSQALQTQYFHFRNGLGSPYPLASCASQVLLKFKNVLCSWHWHQELKDHSVGQGELQHLEWIVCLYLKSGTQIWHPSGYFESAVLRVVQKESQTQYGSRKKAVYFPLSCIFHGLNLYKREFINFFQTHNRSERDVLPWQYSEI